MEEKKVILRVRFKLMILAWGLQVSLLCWVALIFWLFEKMDYGDEQHYLDKARFEGNVYFEHLPEEGTVSSSNMVLPPRIVEPNEDTHPVLPPYSERKE